MLHLDMDAFYASVEQLRRPELRGQPVAVGYDGPRGVVAAASYEARKFGVHSAMPSITARRLCHQLVFIPADFKAYGAASSRVFSVLRRYTPVIEPLALDEAFLDLSGSREARSHPEDVAARIKTEVREVTGGLTSSVGIGASKVVAKIGSDLRKPDGLVVVRPGEEPAFLAPLPIRVLPGLGPAAQRRLDGLGLRTVGDLAALPAAVLTARLGSRGPELQRLAVGDDLREVSIPGMPKSISREVTFERDVVDREKLRQTVRALAQDVTQSLRHNRLWARTVRIKLRYAGFETHTHQATLQAPTDVDKEVLEALERLLDEALPEPRPIRLIGVGASGLSDDTQGELFDPDRNRHHALDTALDQLRQRFGPAAVVRGQPAVARQLDFRRDDLDAAAQQGDDEQGTRR
ncbi:MAG TPA: DNA polymerase IV [Candidatus Dormibacteraeota bacterium]|nr:DNA polymerase IV [Candidatus Dormibacteraeota bacterium]